MLYYLLPLAVGAVGVCYLCLGRGNRVQQQAVSSKRTQENQSPSESLSKHQPGAKKEKRLMQSTVALWKAYKKPVERQLLSSLPVEKRKEAAVSRIQSAWQAHLRGTRLNFNDLRWLYQKSMTMRNVPKS